MNLPDLLGKVRIDNSQAKTALAEVKTESGSAGAAMGAAGKSAASLAVGFTAAAAAAGAVLAVVTDLVRGFAETGSKLVDLNKQLGIGVIEIQKIQYAAKQSGVEFGAVTSALMQMEKAASKSPGKFADLGISFEQLKNAKPDQLLLLISDGLKNVSDQNERARIAMDIFGRGGSQMLKMLTDDFRGLTQEAEGTGLMTEEMAKKADRLGDASAKLDDTVKKLKDNLGAAFASPEMISLMEKTAGMIGLMAQNAEKLAFALKAVASGGSSLGAAAGQGVANWFSMIANGGQMPADFSGVTGGGSSANVRINDTISGNASAVLRAAAADQKRDAAEALRAAKAADEALADMVRDRWKDQQALYSDMKRSNEGSLQFVEKDALAPFGLLPSGADNGKMMSSWLDDLRRKNMAGLEGLDTKILQAAKSTKDWRGALQGVALLAGAIGGKFGSVVGVIQNIGTAFQNAKTEADKFYAVAGGIGQIGGIVGGTAGGTIQGAAGGAMTGYSMSNGNPYAAAAGGIIGGILGLFGGKSKAKQELTELKGQLSQLTDEAKKFGINLDAAFASKNSAVVKAAIDSVTAAMKESEKRMAGLSTAAGGLNAFARGGGITDQASADRAGMYAGAIFGGQVKETGDVVGALRSIGPALAEIAAKAKDMGLSLGAGVSNLLAMNAVIEGNEGLADQVSGLNQLMKGLSDAGMLTKDMFAALGADAAAVFARLVDGGATGNQALMMMQPTLQQLYEGQKLHGYAVDEATQALLDQAKAEGIVGDSFMSANERMVELLEILIETIGGKLPDSYRRAGDAAEDYARRASNLPIPQIPGGGGTTGPNPGNGGGIGGVGGSGFSSGGGIGDAGTRGARSAGQPIVVNLIVDGKLLTSVLTNTIQGEGREVQDLRQALAGVR